MQKFIYAKTNLCEKYLKKKKHLLMIKELSQWLCQYPNNINNKPLTTRYEIMCGINV